MNVGCKEKKCSFPGKRVASVLLFFQSYLSSDVAFPLLLLLSLSKTGYNIVLDILTRL